MERAIQLVKKGVDLTLLVDTVEAAEAVSNASKQFDVSLSAMIEIDVDGHRAGLVWDNERLLPIAEALTVSGRLRGVATHAGGSYNGKSLDDIADIAERERAMTVKASERLREAGYEVPDVSVGSTPTALMARDHTGVTELRAGVYATFDLVMAGLGLCSLDDIAMSVLTSVTGHQLDKGWVLIDAGWMAMSRDRGTASQDIDQGYGLVCDLHGNPLPDYVVSMVNQEHGIITRRDKGPIEKSEFPYASQWRILPNHACATAAQFDHYLVHDADLNQCATWSRVNAW